jgi:hypothetical protein
MAKFFGCVTFTNQRIQDLVIQDFYRLQFKLEIEIDFLECALQRRVDCSSSKACCSFLISNL